MCPVALFTLYKDLLFPLYYRHSPASRGLRQVCSRYEHPRNGVLVLTYLEGMRLLRVKTCQAPRATLRILCPVQQGL